MRKRNPYLDNLKFVLLALVIFGHLIEVAINRDSAVMGLYRAIYLFHIPAFVFIAGFTASRSSSGWRGIMPLLVLLLVFEGLYAVPKLLLHHKVAYEPWTPWKILWFLLSLACWRLAGPWLARLKFPLLITAGLALAAGCFSWIGYPFSLSRTLVFFPFFILGYVHGSRVLALARSWRRHPTYLVGAGLIAGAALLTPLPPEWLYGSNGYGNVPIPEAIGLRTLHLVGALAATVVVFALVPRRECWMTQPGGRTLGPFLWHMFLVTPVSMLVSRFGISPMIVVAGSVVMALGLSIGLTYAPVTREQLFGLLRIRREKPLRATRLKPE